MLIDTHAHIYLEDFDEDVDQMIGRARQNGIQRILLPNIDLRSVDLMKNLATRYPDVCLPMIGLHPCSVGADYREVLDLMHSELLKGHYIAIGETGCDMYWDKSFRTEQMESFAIHAQWAKEHNMPLIIHARDAFDEIFEVLDSENSPNLRGIFHCFTGNAEQAKKILDYGGFMLGIGGVVTYKNSGLSEVLADIDTRHLVLETDAPYLPPIPHRGKRNEPSFMTHTAQKLADIKHLSLEEISYHTTQNAQRMFNLQ